MVVKITVTIPKTIGIDVVKLDKELIKGINGLIDESDKLFGKTYATWRHKPKFTKLKARRVGKGKIRGANFTVDKNYMGVNNGRRPHPISARRKPFLRFRHGSGFSPKTKARTLRSFAGKNTGAWQKRKTVMHPGNKGRFFDSEIAIQLMPQLVDVANEAVQKST